MAFNLSSPVTGTAQTGLTTPTYTLTADTPPNINAKQWAITALGGTQTGVLAHSVASPFTIAQFRPQVFKGLSPVSALTGVLKDAPANVYKTITRKGVVPLAGQAPRNLVITTIIECPAGSDTADSEDVRAALSLHIGALSQQSAGLGDTVINGIL